MYASRTLAAATLAMMVVACADLIAQSDAPLWESRGSGPFVSSNETRIEFAADGRSMLQSLPEAFRRWDASTGRLLSVVPYAYGTLMVTGSSYSPDGRYILRRRGYVLELLEATSGDTVKTSVYNTRDSYQFSRDSRMILATSGNRITFLSVPSLDRVRQIDGENLAGSVLAPDGRELLGIDLGIVVQRDASTGAEIRRLAGLGGVQQIAYALGSETIVGYSGQWLAMWNARSGERTSLMLDRPGFPAPKLVMNSGGRYAVTLSMNHATGDSTMRVWDVLERRRIRDFAVDVRFPLRAVALSPDEKSIVILDDGGTISVIDMGTGRVIRRFATGHPMYAASIASSHDGRVVVTGSHRGELRVFDAADGRLLQTLQIASYAIINELDITSDGTVVALSIPGGSDAGIHILSLYPADSLYFKTGSAGALDIAPDDRHIAMARADGSIGIFELRTGREIRRLPGHPGGVTCVEFSPDGSMLASGGADLSVVAWDVATGELRRMFSGHNGPIVDIVFSRDGREIVSAGTDRRVIASTIDGGQRLLRTMPESVHSLGISADGRSVLVGCTAMHGLDFSTGSITRNFWDHQRLGYGVVYVDKHPSTRVVATASSDGDVVAWSIERRLSAGNDEAGRAVVVAPLPADESITIALPARSRGTCEAMLLDARGVVRGRGRETDPLVASLRLSVSDVESGIYLLVLDADGERSTHTVVVVHPGRR
ncbi:MAG TPA: WD40 repeat domain-containing protein [Candidatus Kapabacteria bacterium]|nr:WD40 repeat domain-containing protein [Candidatus Kapabacteria bacterium]